MQTLLKAGADANQAMSDGRVALTFAAGFGHTATVRALLLAEPRIDQPGPEGLNALSFAKICGQDAIVQILLEAGADKGVLSRLDMKLKDQALSSLGVRPPLAKC